MNIKDSYRRHSQMYKDFLDGKSLSHMSAGWRDPDSIDSWRHRRMYRTLDVLLESHKGSRWLTVGDGRFGNDAHYILTHGHEVVASDISGDLLAEAKNANFIREYRIENAETLSFADESFDYVFCKEAYHHFPRPSIALYEMFRVARCGVVLIEPWDLRSERRTVQYIYMRFKRAAKRLLGRDSSTDQFEEVGNYIFSVSLREIEKIATALGYWAIAWKGLNDYYQPGTECCPAFECDATFRKVRRRIRSSDILTRLHLKQYSLISVIIFKVQTTEIQLPDLRRRGFDARTLPTNPYLKDEVE